MKPTVTGRVGGLLLGLLVAGSASADEAWDTQLGRVYWEDSMDDLAVLRFDDAGGGVGARVYVPGLAADMMGGRGTYRGYWIAVPDGEAGCGAQLTGPDGFKSDQWGQVVLTFVHEGFPSDWAGTYSECFDGPSVALSGVAVVGGQ